MCRAALLSPVQSFTSLRSEMCYTRITLLLLKLYRVPTSTNTAASLFPSSLLIEGSLSAGWSLTTADHGQRSRSWQRENRDEYVHVSDFVTAHDAVNTQHHHCERWKPSTELPQLIRDSFVFPSWIVF